MPELLFPRAPIKTADFCNQDPQTLEQFLRCNPHPSSGSLSPHRAYNTSLDSSVTSQLITQQINSLPAQSREHLQHCVADYGDETLRLAEFYDRHLADISLPTLAQDSNSLAGIGAGVLSGRAESFQQALTQYQRALVALQKHSGTGRGPAAQRSQLRRNVMNAYQNLNHHFHVEMQRIAPPHAPHKNRGNALTGATRGINLAERRRGRGIHINNLQEGKKVARFSNSLSYAGRGLIAVDIGFRSASVHKTYAANGNWQRELAVQTGGFGGSLLTGYATGRTAAIMLSRIALMSTPVGWMILIGSTIAIGAVLAYQADQGGQRIVGSLWDKTF